jgi:uncharacterized protein YbbK (DUF523 family)
VKRLSKNPEFRPRIVVSRCLGFGRCRWNGVELSAEPLAGLEKIVSFIPVCPECEIGLGVPRDPIRLVAAGASIRLLQPASGRDLTREMAAFSRRFLNRLPPVAGFVFKSRSPSCGLVDTPLFAACKAAEPLPGKNGPGLFARAVRKEFPALPLIDDRGLRNPAARSQWLREIGVEE